MTGAFLQSGCQNSAADIGAVLIPLINRYQPNGQPNAKRIGIYLDTADRTLYPYPCMYCVPFHTGYIFPFVFLNLYI